MARIYTRTGDRGDTRLADGNRVRKSDERVEAYGTVDELNSWLGWVIASSSHEDIRRALTQVQSHLFALGSQLAAASPEAQARTPQVATEEVNQLERWIDQFERELEPLRLFLLPGGHPCAAALHLARTVCRRAERRAVALADRDPSLPPILLAYLNRLADLLFVLARVENHRAGVPETRWEPHEDR